LRKTNKKKLEKIKHFYLDFSKSLKWDKAKYKLILAFYLFVLLVKENFFKVFLKSSFNAMMEILNKNEIMQN